MGGARGARAGRARRCADSPRGRAFIIVEICADAQGTSSHDDDDLDITGFSSDDPDGVRVFDLGIARNRTDGDVFDALERQSHMLGRMWGARDEYRERRHGLMRALPSTMEQMFDEWAPGAENVLIRWDSSFVSDQSPNDYRPRAVVNALKMKDGTYRELDGDGDGDGDADEHQDRETYRREAAAGWVNELLSYAIEDRDAIAVIGLQREVVARRCAVRRRPGVAGSRCGRMAKAVAFTCDEDAPSCGDRVPSPSWLS